MRKCISLIFLITLTLGCSGFCMDSTEEDTAPTNRITLKLKDDVSAGAIESIAAEFGLTDVEKRRTKGFYKASVRVLDPTSILKELNQRSEIETAYINKPAEGQLLAVY